MASRYWVGGSGVWDNTTTTNWASVSGGAGGASAPVAADTVFFDSGSGTGTVDVKASAVGTAVTVNKVDITLSFSGSPTFLGIFTLTSGTLTLGANTLTVFRFLNQTTTTRVINFDTGKIVVTGNNSTVVSWQGTGLTITGSKDVYSTYSGATGIRTFSMSGTDTTENNVPNIYITAGTDTISSLARVRTLDFTGFKGTYTAATAKAIYGSLIFDPGMTITGSANNHTFSATTGPFVIKTAGLTMDFPILFAGTAIGGIWEFQDALTMGANKTLSINAGTVKFKAGTTNTSTTWNFTGTAAVGRQISIQSTIPGTTYTLSQATGTVSTQYMTIKDSVVTGGAIWEAYRSRGNIDAGNNTGWDFLSVDATRSLSLRMGMGL